MNSIRPVCLITGVGHEKGTGAAIAKYFSANGFSVAMIARSHDRLLKLEKKYHSTKAYPCDLSEKKDIFKTIKKVQTDMGHPEVVIHNAPMATRGGILSLDPKDLEKNFRVPCSTPVFAL